MAILKGNAVLEQVLDAANLDGVLGHLSRHDTTDLLILDYELPGLDGHSGIRFLRSKFPAVRIVVMPGAPDRDLILKVLKAGVHGCIPKTLPSEEMLSAFRMVIAGHIYVPSAVSEVDGARPSARILEGPALRPELTDRQVDVLRLMANGKSNQEIAAELGIAEGTVKVHVNAAYRTLGVHNRAGAIAALKALEVAQSGKEPWIPGLASTSRSGGDLLLLFLVTFSGVLALDVV